MTRRSRDPEPLPVWWPQWSGQPCVLVASGPSATGVDLGLARGRARVVVVNSSWRLAPWADVLYACDFAWWRAEDGCPAFGGLKLAGNPRAIAEGWGCHAVTVRSGVDSFLFAEPGVVGRGGGSSGFHALNLAAQWGCAPLVLVGYDMTLEHGVHWHGRHGPGLGNPNEALVARWRHCLDAAAPVLKSRGIKVLNASATSALRAYPRTTLEEALCL